MINICATPPPYNNFKYFTASHAQMLPSILEHMPVLVFTTKFCKLCGNEPKKSEQ
jgi:hypothetical protein